MKRAFFNRLLPGVAVFATLFSMHSLNAADLSGEEVYKRALKSTVWIVVQEGEGISMASGSLIDVKQRLVLTNHHVVEGIKDTCFVQFPILDKKGNLVSEKKLYFDAIKSNGAITATVLFSEKSKDLALIKLSSLPKGVEAVHLADETPGPGAEVHSIGNAGASDALFVYSPGKVRSSYVKKYSSTSGGMIHNIEAKIIESTSPTSAGDSGGPLFNSKGEQVGVTQGGRVDLKASGYSYFIDASEVKTMLRNHKITLSPNPQVVSNNPKKEPTDEPKIDATTDTNTTTKVEPKAEPKKVEPKNTAAADEKAAESKLSLVKTFIDQGKKEIAITRLNDLIKNYPNTDAAKEAKELLKKLK